MELKPGYKQTAVGAVPKEWDVAAAGTVGKLRGGSGFPLKWQGARDGDYPFFKVSDMNNEGNETFMVNANNRISEATRKHIGAQLFPARAVVFAKVGAAVFLERKRILAEPSCIDNNMTAFVLDASRADPRFIHASFLMMRLGDLVATTALPSLSGKQLSEILLRVPPLDEQRIIAAALSDVDVLLDALDRFIAKKRNLKQATMQQLLTGQIRLPGFDQEWHERPLGEVIAALEAGVSVNSVNDDEPGQSDDRCILKTSSVAGGRFYPGECKKIASRDHGRAKVNPRRDTLLISRMNTPELVGECGYVDRDYPNLFVPDRLWMTRFRPEADINARWLAYLLSTSEQRGRIGAAATGTSGSMKNLSKQAFLSLRVSFPSSGEQTEIVEVLSDMDTEIVALEQRRDKTRLLKQGMMQELITGRTRLV